MITLKDLPRAALHYIGYVSLFYLIVFGFGAGLSFFEEKIAYTSQMGHKIGFWGARIFYPAVLCGALLIKKNIWKNIFALFLALSAILLAYTAAPLLGLIPASLLSVFSDQFQKR